MAIPSRRSFIQSTAFAGLAATAGYGADSMEKSSNCIVVGAGLAGLAAAYRLRLAGHKNIRIIEKSPRAGGICWTNTEHGYRFPMGTTYLAKPWKGSAAKEIYAQLPKKWWEQIPEPEDSFYYNGRVIIGATVFHDWERIPGITEKQKADCQAVSDWFLSKTDDCEWPIWSNRKGKLSRYETMTALEMIKSIRPDCDPWVLGCIDSFTRGVFNGNLGEIGGLQAIEMIGDEYEPKGKNISGRTTHVAADLVDALIAEIGPESFLFGAEAMKIRKYGKRVEVMYLKDGHASTETCKYCVVATNAGAARKIVEDVPDHVKRVLDSIQYGEYAVVNLVMANHTVPINAFDCTLGDNVIDDIYDFTFLRKKQEGIPLDQPPGIYGCYLAAKSLSDHTPTMPKDKLVELCLAQIDAMFGGGARDKVTSTHVSQYAQGMPIFRPGLTWEQEDNLMPMFNERIILAGDYVQGSPTIEGALESGWYAGKKVKQQLAA